MFPITQSVLALSGANHDAYVLDRRAADAAACAALTGNRSHIFVDDDSTVTTMHPAKGNFNEPFKTIQLGIQAVVPGGTVYVAEGTYTEQVTLTKSVHLLGAGAGSSVIAAPATLPPSSNVASSIVLISGSGVDVELTGFTITGPGPSTCGSIRTGIYVYNGANADIHHNTIQDIRDEPFSGCQNGVAIMVGRQYWSTTGTANIENNTIVGYQKGGIVVDNSGSNATITDNTITGVGATSVIAQNGIQISRGATATLSGNTVTGNSFHLEGNPWDWGSAGILYYQAGAVTMAGGNTTANNDQNLYVDSATAATFGAETIGPSSAPLDWGYDVINLTTLDLDLRQATFPWATSNAEIEARVWHKVDDAALGWVLWTNPNPTLTAEVKDSNGNPIEGASIVYAVGSPHAGWQSFGTTGADGTVSKSGLTVGVTYYFYAQYNNSTSLQQSVVFDGEDTVTFETVSVKVKVETCPGVPLEGAVITYGSANGGFYNFGVTGSDGLVAKELFPGNERTFYARFNHTTSAHQTVTIVEQTEPLVTFKTTAVTLYNSGSIVHGSANGGWYPFTKPTMEMFAGTHTFKIGGIVTPIEVSGCSMSKAVNILKLTDHNGQPLAGGTARGGFGANYSTWHVTGSTDANGVLVDVRSVSSAPTTMSYEMKFNNTTQVKTQDVSTNSVFEFQTSLVNMRLQTCDGTGLENGKVRYGIGGVYTTWWFPGGPTNASGDTFAEFFPGTYSFEMQYQGTAQSKLNVTLPDASPVVWNTTKVTLQYSGQISYGGPSGQSAWFTKPSMNLLPGGPYKFHFQNPEGGLLDLSWSGCEYTASVAAIKLIDSTGAGIAGATGKYYDGGWKDIPGTTNADGLLPVAIPGMKGKVSFKVYYAGAHLQKMQNIAADSIVVFQTKLVTFKLLDSTGSELAGGAQYYAGGWKTFGSGTTTTTMELLPMTYSFKVSYGGAHLDKNFNIAKDPNVVFQTGSVHSDSGTCTQYYAGGWKPFTQDMELLPGSYSFKFTGFPQKKYKINAGTVNHIH